MSERDPLNSEAALAGADDEENAARGNVRILMIDDEEDLLRMLQRRLRLEGFEVEIASSPHAGLEKFRDTRFEIVISDIRMPGMTGIDLLAELKGLNPLCQVIMITGYSNMFYVMECLGGGAVDYFAKPLDDLDKLIAALDGAAERAGRWRRGMGMPIMREVE